MEEVSGLSKTKGKRGRPRIITTEIGKYITQKFAGRSFEIGNEKFSAAEEYKFASHVADEIKTTYGVKIAAYSIVQHAYGWNMNQRGVFSWQTMKENTGEKKSVKEQNSISAETKTKQEYKTQVASTGQGIEVTGDSTSQAYTEQKDEGNGREYQFSPGFLSTVEAIVSLKGNYSLSNDQIRNALRPRNTPKSKFDEAKDRLSTYLQKKGYTATKLPNGMMVQARKS